MLFVVALLKQSSQHNAFLLTDALLLFFFFFQIDLFLAKSLAEKLYLFQVLWLNCPLNSGDTVRLKFVTSVSGKLVGILNSRYAVTDVLLQGHTGNHCFHSHCNAV